VGIVTETVLEVERDYGPFTADAYMSAQLVLKLRTGNYSSPEVKRTTRAQLCVAMLQDGLQADATHHRTQAMIERR
jgi:hypothetical protein